MSEPSLGREIMKALLRAKQAPPEERRNPLRWSIIADLCAEFCARLHSDGKTNGNISAESREYMKNLKDTFEILLVEPTKVTMKFGGEIDLTEAGYAELNATD